jgi:hypothetical protein
MAYNQFTLQRVVADFGLSLNSVPDLFPGVPPCPLDPGIRGRLPQLAGLATMVNTESARSHLLIAPLLWELLRVAGHGVSLLAGTRFDVDEEAGLNGVCDFILSRPPQLSFPVGPLLMIVEAKNEDIWGGVGQAAAAVVAAQRFNRRQGHPVPDVYGASTDGTEWRFFRLRGTALDIDTQYRAMTDPDQLLGILLYIAGVPPVAG